MAGLIKRPCTVNLQCHDVKDIDGDLLQSLAMATQTDIIEDLDVTLLVIGVSLNV